MTAPPTILIVDDTPSNLGMVVNLLEGHGYRVAIAQDGEEGLQRAQILLPDLILLDVMMPGVDGFEVCQSLKALEVTRNIPVIFMTALASTEHKVKGFTLGGVDYLTKPLQIEEVIARVDTHIRLHAAQRQLEIQNAQLQARQQEYRELTAHIQTVREEEKARLAREIHDDLGSMLAALNLRLSHLLDVEFSGDMKKTPLFTRLKSMSEILENAIASTRRIITDMRPDVLDNLGLFAALKWQAEQFQKYSGIACRVVCANDRSCVDCADCAYPQDKTLSINLFRIFQEVLSNVARHSGASRVDAEYRQGNRVLVLSICDNGRGLPDGHIPASTSFGIRGMRERVGQLGGQIKFDKPLGGGLCVTVQLPLAAGNIGYCDNPG